MIRVVAVDDHPYILEMLEILLGKEPDIQLVGTADHGSKLTDLMQYHPDIAILDIGMQTGEFKPVSYVRNFKQQYPQVKVLILSAYTNGVRLRALVKVGISGYMLKSDSLSMNIAGVIRRLYAGKSYFSRQIEAEVFKPDEDPIKVTDREITMIRLMAQGKTIKAMADCLGLSENRVQNLVTTIYDKFGIEKDGDVSPRFTLIKKARVLGLLLPDDELDPNLEETA